MNQSDQPVRPEAQRVRRFNIGISVAILLVGVGLGSPLGFWDQATRKVLAERCSSSFEATDDMSSDRLGEVLDKCANRLGWGTVEAFVKVLDHLTSGAWFFFALVIALAFTHPRIARTRGTRTLGERLATRMQKARDVTYDQG